MGRNGPELHRIPIPRPGRWIHQARCQGRDVANFYPETGDLRTARAAKTFCDGCPVRLPCLEYALSLPDGSDFGIWGATSKKQRAELRRAAKLAAVLAERFPPADQVAHEHQRSHRPLPPCGTTRAYLRHRRRGEDIDPACRVAGREYQRRAQREYRRRRAEREAEAA